MQATGGCNSADTCGTAVQVKDPSLLRFLVDMREADLSDKQLRDDLMTMLIAGHETTAAVLTWTLFALMNNPEVEGKMLQEIDSVLGDKTPGAQAICSCLYTIFCGIRRDLPCSG